MSKRVPDTSRQKQAIANAFRVACLSIHGKPLHHVAVHYQDVMDLPYSVDDPKVYYDKLETARIRHNGANGIHATAHKPHQKSLEDFYRYIQVHYPHLSPSQAREEGDRQAHIFQYEIEDKLHRERPDKPFDESEAFKLLDRKLKNFMKPHKEAAAEPKSFDNPNAYYGFHQHSAWGMANASKNIDNLYQWANEDVGKGGDGHHFRDQILTKNIKHLGPREIGLAWYLLSPNRSELAYIDNTILDALGYKPKDYTPRDHALYERQLMAGRDASGYHHMPLGQFQKGLMDVYQGPTSHETLAVHDPVRVEHVNWQPQPAPHVWPEWWNETKSYRDDVAKKWNASIGKYHPPQTVMAKIARHPKQARSTLRIIMGGDHHELRVSLYDVHHKNYSGSPVKIISDERSIRVHAPFLSAPAIFPRLIGRLGTFITRLEPHEFLEHTATVGPNVDNSINDPLANNVTESMPSWEFLTDDGCERCHGNEVISLNGKVVACPECQDWARSHMFNDPSTPDPSLHENPEPGQINPSPSLSSP